MSFYHTQPSTDQRRNAFSQRKRTIFSLGLTLFILLTFSVSFFVFAPLQHSHAETTTQKPSLGINLGEPDNNSFTDVMKTSSNVWDRQDGTTGNSLLDSNGWPTTDAGQYVWQGLSKSDGTYSLSFNGQATLSFPGNPGVQLNNQQYDAATNTTTASIVVSDTGSINFYITFTNTKRTATSTTDTGFTNVKLMKPVSEGSTTSYDPSTTFTPYVAQAVAPYTYIRFMFGTNWNKSVNWSDRTSPGYATQYKLLPGEVAFEGNQIAFEYMVKIANDNNKDLYICVPDRANNDYITKLAQLVLYGSDGVNPYTAPQDNPTWAPLKSNLKLYVEYTNEAWNFQFDQAHDLYDGPIGSQQEIASNPNSPLIYDGNTNGDLTWHRNYANRALNVSKIFHSVFGDAAIGARVRPLIFWQYNNLNSTAEQELLFLNDYYNNADGIQHVSDPHPLSYYFWGGGGAAYFNSNNNNASSVDALFAAGIPEASYQGNLDTQVNWSRMFGLHPVAYEGSWGIEGAVGDQGRVDPRAKQALIDSFTDWAKAGGELYTAGTFGQWNDIRQANTYPLVQAAAVVNDPTFTTPATTQGIAVSATDATVIRGPHYSFSRTGLNGASTNLGNETSYLINVNGSASYQVAVSVANNADGGKIGVYADSELLSTISVPNTGSTSSYQTVVAGTTTFSAGLHSIVLRAQAGGKKAGTINAVILQPGTGTIANVPTPGALPAGWQSQDIGSVGQAGSGTFDNNTFSITGSGGDISNTTDEFQYTYQQVTGDTTIVARITWLGDSNPYAKAGVMIRGSLTGGSANAITYYSPSGDTTFQERLTDGGNTSHGTPPQRGVPTWVKLVRTGNVITSFISSDGSTWTQVGTDTYTFPNTVYVGLAVDAHDNGTLVTGDFDNVSINGTTVQITPTPGVTPTPGTTPTPGVTPTATPGSGSWIPCATEPGVCTVPGTVQVRYGANGQYFYKTVTGQIGCNNVDFGGDPIPNVVKSCDYQ